MTETKEMREAMLRLSSIGRMQYHYDAVGRVSGEGEIHYLVEVSNLFFLAWEDNNSGTMVLNPITRFGLDELEELGTEEPWTVLCVPETLAEGIQFREIGGDELSKAYHQMERRTIAASLPPVVHAFRKQQDTSTIHDAAPAGDPAGGPAGNVAAPVTTPISTRATPP